MTGSASAHVPYRIFLDTNVLQALQEHGGTIWENEPFFKAPRDRSGADAEDAKALRWIFRVTERAHFDFALSEGSLDEVAASGQTSFWRWALDVLDHWRACVNESPSPFEGWGQEAAARIDASTFDCLSRKVGGSSAKRSSSSATRS